MNIEGVYDSLGEGYLDIFKTSGMKWVMQYEQSLVTRQIPEVPSIPNVLEVGTGPGRLSAEVVKRNVSFTGLDISEAMVKSCRKRIGDGATLLQLDVSKGLPLESNSFDYIYSLRVLKYVPDLEYVFGEIFRVLKPGGTFLFNLPNALSINILCMNEGVRNDEYTISEMVFQLEQIGFTSIEVIGGPKLPNFLYKTEREAVFRLIEKTEQGLGRILSYKLTREPFYLCKKV